MQFGLLRGLVAFAENFGRTFPVDVNAFEQKGLGTRHTVNPVRIQG